jgi:hypothetical protein
VSNNIRQSLGVSSFSFVKKLRGEEPDRIHAHFPFVIYVIFHWSDPVRLVRMMNEIDGKQSIRIDTQDPVRLTRVAAPQQKRPTLKVSNKIRQIGDDG